MGMPPWQTIGTENAWEAGEETALFYPTPEGSIPSVTLKAFAYGQQLVEYLTLFSQTYNLPRYSVVQWLEDKIYLGRKVDKNSENNAGIAQFQQVDSTVLWQLRYTLGEMISKKALLYKRSLVDFESPVFDPKKFPDIGYVSLSPVVNSLWPVCSGFGDE